MPLEPIIIDFCCTKLDQQCARIETCVDKLTPEQIWPRHAENENAAGNLMLHLSGNVRQWILHGVGGAPDHRQRHTEFEARGNVDSVELKHRLRSTVDEAIAVLRAVPPERLTERAIIQNYDVTILEAILHVVEHFSGHTGQIIFATKLWTGEDMGFYAYLNKPKRDQQNRP